MFRTIYINALFEIQEAKKVKTTVVFFHVLNYGLFCLYTHENIHQQSCCLAAQEAEFCFGLEFYGGMYSKKLFLSLLKKERHIVYIEGTDFKQRSLNNVYNHVYNIWQQTGQSSFLETVFFYHSQHAFGFGPASSRSFSISLGIFFYKRSNQLRVIIICFQIYIVFLVILPVRIRLKIVTFKLLKNNRVVLSTCYADLSAFLHLIQFG